MLQLQNITYTYDKNFVMENITFDLEKGETLAIVGPSGSGKTTLLKMILGSILPDSGKIILDSTNITELEIEKRNIGYCPQDQLLFPHMNVFDNIAIGLKAKKYSKQSIKDRVQSLAKMSDIDHLLKRKTNKISGGQKQRVSILRALANNPKLLLLDEPFHNLDAQIKGQIVSYIKKIQTIMKVSIIFVTHDITEAKLLADKILILIDGHMKQVGTPRQLSFKPNSYEVAMAMQLPNVFPIIDYNKESSSIKLEFGEVQINNLDYKNQKNVLINPIAVELCSFDPSKQNVFHGSIKGITFDLLAQKQILSVQIAVSNKREELKEQIIQIALHLDELEFEKNQEIDFLIKMDSLAFF